MTKDRNNGQPVQNGEFSLPRKKVLRGRKNFQRLFEPGVQVCRTKHAGIRYRIIDCTSFGCHMGFIVKKKLGKAHQRNYMKRLLREAYRLHQHILSDSLQEAGCTLHGALVAHTADAAFKDVEQDVVTLLKQVQNQFPTASPGHS